MPMTEKNRTDTENKIAGNTLADNQTAGMAEAELPADVAKAGLPTGLAEAGLPTGLAEAGLPADMAIQEPEAGTGCPAPQPKHTQNQHGQHSQAHPHPHGHTHSHTQTQAVLNRMSRAIGHMEAVKRMVEDGRDCSEVLIQIAAVRSAINNIGKIILEDHISHCIVDAVEHGDGQALEDLKNAIDKFVK